MRIVHSILFLAVICQAQKGDRSPVAGTWHGESKCVQTGTACRDETVVYYIEDIPGQPDTVMIRADKIVDGKAITMGTSEWKYDRSRQVIEWITAPRTWLLKVDGSRIEGTLKLSDGTLVRRMNLEKR